MSVKRPIGAVAVNVIFRFRIHVEIHRYSTNRTVLRSSWSVLICLTKISERPGPIMRLTPQRDCASHVFLLVCRSRDFECAGSISFLHKAFLTC
ncbi:hypothetical protein MPTK2_3g18240 [Marchantia polymorpha subsp. ruderalis]